MKLSYSVVLYRNSVADVLKLYRNLVETVPCDCEYMIYLVNNSKDDTELEQCLKQIADSDENVILITAEDNNGFGAGHNLAIRQANSAVHFLVNPDITIPNSDQISKLVDKMRNQDIVMCAPKVLNTDGTIQKLVKHSPTVLDMGIRFLGRRILTKRQDWFVYSDEYNVTHESINLAGSFMACRTKTLKKIGGFDERYFLYMEDSDLTRSMARYGATIYYPDAYVVHAWQRENRKSLKGIRIMLQSMGKYFAKWGWKLW
ncbi:glycosyltransferase [Lacticaseibacillus paracasei]|uniref:glycosyltransferase n=1 Tax=Lacticaseibacillus paracasei TaxID=1597 RepID=UPI00161AE4D7|nr:glycosyltransferase [Lacticaseibacillus paracasei]